MQPFTALRGVAVPFDEANIDTNQLCPTRFNRLPNGPGFERVLFHDRRFNADGSEKPDFILNRAPYRQARIIVGDRNFGCGSSRETAVTALIAFGIRAVIASGYGDIFFNNALKNGVLPVVLDAPVVSELRARLHAAPGLDMAIDLADQTVRVGNDPPIAFAVEALTREKLMLGLDDIGLTQRFAANLPQFETAYYETTPWLPASGRQ